MKILCTGNPKKGIAKEICNLFPNADFISRTNGYDLNSINGQEDFKNIISNYDVFINHSQLDIGVQIKLLEYTNNAWDKGIVINIGSIIEFPKWEWIDLEAAIDKRKLRDLSLNLINENFKTSYLILGGLISDCAVEYLDPLRIYPSKVANIIKWILENDLDIPLIYIDKMSDKLSNFWLDKKTS
jgi:hypothetical protein